MKLEKIYAVKFRKYANCLKDTVSDWDGHGDPLKADIKYLDTQGEAVLIKESDFEYYKKFGGGYDSIEFIGLLHVPDVNTENISDESNVQIKDIHSTGCPAVDNYSITVSCES